mmetsp:Transcript_34842/g.74271  ORF Transcript_34842/g.74271 Transcript_34842/m.74271 type:complete len:172 (+) Transcript_34842:140-655(+)|eukprot:CAMPEP_0172554018 /NCGR_PEP_ID=MMETSP1067-20121228/52789_1 /TAXON_ID=265564 ORGANISM="Thalassiosira punctigera, Strain Tpunct2005C2" /NCGR_SAMPLE_ID=MMETSP1067 /ASSEMBLY_ACC=CAM_ASM_000444 /LENGTH=171 /DNA_ID=CAMNT_0013342305 /DNA_START=127 /DNA_END=642 /DNA_ORIENTATION=-
MGLKTINTGEQNNPRGCKAKRRNKPSVKPGGVKSGRWTDSERRMFLKGLKKFGRGKWKEIATLIPTRSTVQVKTHAQMVMKRVEQGEDVFAEFSSSSSSGQQGISNNDIHGFAMSTKVVPHSTIDTLKLYDGLSQKDQGAVHILYQMAQVRACVYYDPQHNISPAACFVEN